MLGWRSPLTSTPIVVSSLGLKAFGIWAVSGAIAQYGALLDLGIGRAITRFVALPNVRIYALDYPGVPGQAAWFAVSG